MLIKKAAAGLASGAALALFMSAGAAQAGGPSLTVAPNPSLAGQSVTLSSTNFGGGCSGASVEFRDVTGGGNKALCTAAVSAGGAVSCSTNLLTDTGTRTIHGVATTPPCLGWTAVAAPQTVNAAPTAVPTTSEWTLWGLTGLLLIGGGVFASRRFRATAA